MRNCKSRQSSRGFTFIELLYVAGTIGILFAIALPAYRDYLMRARTAEALVQLSFAREEVSNFYSRWGYFPADNAQAGLLPPEKIKGNYLRSLEVKDGALHAHINFARNPEDTPVVQALTLRPLLNLAHPSAPIIWFCGNGDPKKRFPELSAFGEVAANPVTEKILPAPCRSWP